MDEKRPSILKLTPEAKVGLFVLLGIIILVYMSLRIGGFRLGREDGYILTVDFDTAAGLDPDASVRVAGVEVGKVKEITLKDNKAHLVLRIIPGLKIGRDFTAVLTTKGLLGEKYLELIPGSPNAPPLKEGEQITRTLAYADMDKLITIMSDVSADIKKVTETLSNVIGGPEGENTLKRILLNVEDVSSRINKLVAKNDERFGNIMENLDEFTTLLRKEGPEISTGLKDTIRNLNESLLATSQSLNQMIEENRGGLKEGVENLKVAAVKLQDAMDTINKVTKDIGPQINEAVSSVGSIAKKIDRGEGTLGKLVNDPVMHENLNKTISGINSYIEKTESFHTYLGYRGEYLFDANDAKSYFSLRIQPKADKYYLLEVVDDPRGRRKKETREVTSGATTTTTTELNTSDALKFSAQFAKRFNYVTIRGGIIESTGGVAIDLHLFKDRVRLTLEAFDFNQQGNPHLKAGGTFILNKYFFLTAGYDDFLSKYSLQSTYMGLGIQFDDDDLKYLMSSAPPISF